MSKYGDLSWLSRQADELRRKPGQVAIIDVTTEARAGGSDLGAGKPGCPACIDGQPGEWARRDAIHTIRFCDAPVPHPSGGRCRALRGFTGALEGAGP